jgi:serine/threonine-protein kinase RsbW
MQPLSAVTLDVGSDPEALDLIELVTEHVSRGVGFEEDARYWIVAAVREAAMNANDHANRRDPTKRVVAEFATVPLDNASEPLELVIRIRDEGHGFDPEAVPDPTAVENLLKPSGRGLLLMRQVMDDVQIGRALQGGTEIRLVKRLEVSSPDNQNGMSARHLRWTQAGRVVGETRTVIGT